MSKETKRQPYTVNLVVWDDSVSIRFPEGDAFPRNIKTDLALRMLVLAAEMVVHVRDVGPVESNPEDPSPCGNILRYAARFDDGGAS